MVLTGHGINCDRETKDVLDHAGFEAKIVHINDLINGEERFSDYKMIVFAGGFSYGDDLGSGKAFAAMIRNHLWDQLQEFKENQGLMIGICNGFQIMAHLGLFGEKMGEKSNSLLYNNNARYQCRWVELKINPNSPCIFTKGIEKLRVPIAHGEGKFYVKTDTLDKLQKNEQIAVTYIDNPNGSVHDIAGICDPTGRIFGLMPHPERASFFHHLPDFHKEKERLKREGREIPYEGPGVQVFKNALNHLEKAKC